MTAHRIADAIGRLRRDFPFPGYTEPLESSYVTVADAVCRRLPEGSRILDFASGPCDKTAVLARLGYQCWACDDLQDNWHLLPGVADRIVEFSRAEGIHFRRAAGSP